jgi:CRP-like cAMP-binding protein
MAAMPAIDERFESVFQMLVPINGLSVQQQQQLLARADILDFGRREFLFREGDRDDYAFFLLDGTLELLAQDQLVKRVVGGSSDGVHPLAQLQPRQLSARAKSPVTVLRVDRGLMDKLLAIDFAGDAQDVMVSEIEAEDDGDWMTRMLQSELFSRVPAANIQRIFTKFESVQVSAGDLVIAQDGLGDFYYVIQQGRCKVSRQTAAGKSQIKLAELGPGDSFGEEALVSDSQRNANVEMLTDGELMRLAKEDFVELIKNPLLTMVDLAEGKSRVADNAAKWIDVRFPEEYANGAIEGSINQSLNTLRMHAERLDKEQTYIVYCDSGSRSSVAAFLLSERGFDVHCLRGGLLKYGILNSVDQQFAGELDQAAFDTDKLALTPDAVQDTPITVAALVPSSHQSETEQDRRGSNSAIDADEVVDAEIRAQALKAELGKANIKLEEARRYKEHAEYARTQLAKSAAKKLDSERKELAEQAQRAKLQVKEAESLKKELARAKQEAQLHAAEIEAKRAAELAEANRQVEEARQLKKELAQAKRDAQDQAKKLKQKEKEDLGEANKQLAEARRLIQEAEEAKRNIEHEAAERTKAEQEKLAAEARRAKEVLDEAQRIKEEITREKEVAEEHAEKRRLEQEAKFERMQRDSEQRMREEEQKLAESYAWQAEELTRLQAMKDEAESELRGERERLKSEASEAKTRLLEAKRIQHEVEQTRIESSKEAEERRLRQVELERKLRDEVQEKIVSERHKIEAEFARNAEELERARREKDAAEAARIAAAEEAERIIQEYKETHAVLRETEEQKLLAERERLERDSAELRQALEQSRIEKEEALALQRQTEDKILALEQNVAAGKQSARVAKHIAALEEEAQEARETAEAAEEAQRKAEAAASANREFMEQNQNEENESRDRFEDEIAGWLEEQEAYESSDLQQQILANQKAHLERIKDRAQSAREAAKHHDQTLIEELANRFREDESS